jgi:hypothetical protein
VCLVHRQSRVVSVSPLSCLVSRDSRQSDVLCISCLVSLVSRTPASCQSRLSSISSLVSRQCHVSFISWRPKFINLMSRESGRSHVSLIASSHVPPVLPIAFLVPRQSHESLTLSRESPLSSISCLVDLKPRRTPSISCLITVMSRQSHVSLVSPTDVLSISSLAGSAGRSSSCCHQQEGRRGGVKRNPPTWRRETETAFLTRSVRRLSKALDQTTTLKVGRLVFLCPVSCLVCVFPFLKLIQLPSERRMDPRSWAVQRLSPSPLWVRRHENTYMLDVRASGLRSSALHEKRRDGSHSHRSVSLRCVSVCLVSPVSQIRRNLLLKARRFRDGDADLDAPTPTNNPGIL